MKTKKFIKQQDEFNAEAAHHIHHLIRKVNDLQEFVRRSDDQMEYNEERMTRFYDAKDARRDVLQDRISVLKAEVAEMTKKLNVHDIAFHPIYNGMSRCDGRLNDLDERLQKIEALEAKRGVL